MTNRKLRVDEMKRMVSNLMPLILYELQLGKFSGVLKKRKEINRERILMDAKRSPARLQLLITQKVSFLNCTSREQELQDYPRGFLQMNRSQIREFIEEKMGAITSEELEFAIEQFEENCRASKSVRKLYDSTELDILVTNIDFFRRNKLSQAL